MIRKLGTGFLTYFRSLAVIKKRPSLLKFVLIPMLINIAVYVGVIYFASTHFGTVMDWFISTPSVWYTYVLYYAVAVVLVVSYSLTVVLSFTIVGNLIAAPFNDLLSGNVAGREGGLVVQESGGGLTQFFSDAKRVIFIEMKKMILLIVVGLGSLFLNLIPLLGIVSSIIAVILLAFEYIDYNFSREMWPVRKRMVFIKDHLFESIGFGFAVGLGLVIPLLNFFSIPMAVIGGTLLFSKSVSSN